MPFTMLATRARLTPPPSITVPFRHSLHHLLPPLAPPPFPSMHLPFCIFFLSLFLLRSHIRPIDTPYHLRPVSLRHGSGSYTGTGPTTGSISRTPSREKSTVI
ncbi:hypothetical protein EX30DRAFT_63822 [Ascodesmis nigricans]|uniref:Uncharacterized protein n=1 Tax=Ascodesmis nigricans TaxID=341454 RepID=A0A4S2MUI3_9PEZI|nr:hypothetical protein EX30DRAFT_63822 [Ascodesmis nigricans]